MCRVDCVGVRSKAWLLYLCERILLKRRCDRDRRVQDRLIIMHLMI